MPQKLKREKTTLNTRIEKAQLSDWEALLHIYLSCADWLSKRGYDHWQGAFSEAQVRKRLQEMEVHILYRENVPVGAISLSNRQADYYKEEYNRFWRDRNSMAIYIRGLAVLPEHHYKGFAVQLMDFAEQKVKEKGILYVRFDSLRADDRLTEFYLRRGYVINGRSEHHNFYEKHLR